MTTHPSHQFHPSLHPHQASAYGSLTAARSPVSPTADTPTITTLPDLQNVLSSAPLQSPKAALVIPISDRKRRHHPHSPVCTCRVRVGVGSVLCSGASMAISGLTLSLSGPGCRSPPKRHKVQTEHDMAWGFVIMHPHGRQNLGLAPKCLQNSTTTRLGGRCVIGAAAFTLAGTPCLCVKRDPGMIYSRRPKGGMDG